MVGFTETNDLNGDSFADYKMIYANGEEQYFFSCLVFKSEKILSLLQILRII